MNNVDRRDHLSHEYNLDGGVWRDRKWWMPIFKELFKSCCDQGYVCYKCILCESSQAARVQEVKAAEVKATNDAIEAAKRAAGDSPIDEAGRLRSKLWELSPAQPLCPKEKSSNPCLTLTSWRQLRKGL